jgi:hypothetical protein
MAEDEDRKPKSPVYEGKRIRQGQVVPGFRWAVLVLIAVALIVYLVFSSI